MHEQNWRAGSGDDSAVLPASEYGPPRGGARQPVYRPAAVTVFKINFVFSNERNRVCFWWAEKFVSGGSKIQGIRDT